MYKYEIIIYWDEQDRLYIADVPELPGCSAHGKTYNEALDNAKELFNYGLIRLTNLETRCLRQKVIV